MDKDDTIGARDAGPDPTESKTPQRDDPVSPKSDSAAAQTNQNKAAPRRAVAKAVVSKAVAKRLPTKQAPAAQPASARTVAKATFTKRTTTKRPIAKAVIKAAAKKAPVAIQDQKPDPLPTPEQKSPAKPPEKPVAQVISRPDRDPKLLLRQALRAHQTNKLEEAEDLYQRTLKLDPDNAAAWINMGVLLRRRGQLETAVTCLKRGIALTPNDGPAWSNLGNALRSSNRLDDALMAQRRALDLSSDVARIHYNFGLTMRDKGDLEQAASALRRADLLGYDAPELGWDIALTHLLAGKLRDGFQAYENRWNLPESTKSHQSLPAWDGKPLKGRTLLVWAEQGMGDTIQFCRYLTDAVDGIGKSGGKIVLEVQAPLARVLQRSPNFSKITVIPRGTKLPPCDLQVPLLSLPRLCGTEMDSIPDHCPYIIVPTDTTKPSGLRRDRLNVGLCWAGKPSHKNDRNRSSALHHFASLLDLPGTDFISLQKGPAAQDIQDLSLSPLLRDMGSGFRDFADTAAVLRDLDLIITVDTSVAHFAGAMARPVWVLLPYAPDWRWMLRRDDCPWYPSMTLFRQTSPGDWPELFTRVRQALIRKLRSFG
jgi:tetratricopeptide (TPR) repeat protein